MSSKNLSKIILVVFALSITSCSLKNRIFAEDEAAKKEINSFIHDYSSEDWEVRLQAVKDASKYTDTPYSINIISFMLTASDDYHPLIRIEAVRNLKRMKSYAALEKLRKISLTEQDTNVRRTAITALQDYSQPANADIFIMGIESRDWLTREASYTGLLKIRPEEYQRQYIGKIIKGMKDPILSVRISLFNNVKLKDPLLYNEIAGVINNRKTEISLLKSALVAVNGYALDDRTRGRLQDLLTHRNKDIRLLSLQALKRDKIESSF